MSAKRHGFDISKLSLEARKRHVAAHPEDAEAMGFVAEPKADDMLADAKPKLRRGHPEDDLQMATAEVMQLPEFRHLVAWHTPNAARRRIQTGRRLKKMGMLAGVPDWTIIDGFPRVLFVELKAQGSYQTPSQRAFAERVVMLGCQYYVARSVDEFLAIVRGFISVRDI